jgi:hypothetical protein
VSGRSLPTQRYVWRIISTKPQAEFWLDMQTAYDLDKVKKEHGPADRRRGQAPRMTPELVILGSPGATIWLFTRRLPRVAPFGLKSS